MNSEQFVYWLQGYSEIDGDSPTPEQWQIIQDHLALVFNKVTPDYTDIAKEIGKWTKPNNPYEIPQVIC